MTGSLLILAVLVFAVCADPVQAGWGSQAFRAASCLLCAGLVARGSVRWSWSAVPLAQAAVWGGLQLALHTTVWRFATWQETLQFIAYLALFLAAYQVMELRSHLRVAAWFGGAFSCFAMGVFCFRHAADEPMLGTFANHNHYAALMELIFPVALWQLFRHRQKPPMVLCAAGMFGSVAVGGSRAGLVLLVAEFVYMGFRFSKRPWLVVAGGLAIGAVAAGLMWTRFETLSTREPYDSRSETAHASERMIRERPLAGYGLGTWANVYPAYATRDTGFRLIHADDDWLEWAAEGGLQFASILLCLGGLAARAAWREPWCAGCVAVLLHSLVEFPMQKQAICAWFVVLLAVAEGSLKTRVVKGRD